MAAAGAGGGFVSSPVSARGRFPGRPGWRWRRARLSRTGNGGSTEASSVADPALKKLLDLSKSLRRLRRACAANSETGAARGEQQELPEQGDSEEEEEETKDVNNTTV